MHDQRDPTFVGTEILRLVAGGMRVGAAADEVLRLPPQAGAPGLVGELQPRRSPEVRPPLDGPERPGGEGS